jgi:hypothetical protein
MAKPIMQKLIMPIIEKNEIILAKIKLVKIFMAILTMTKLEMVKLSMST